MTFPRVQKTTSSHRGNYCLVHPLYCPVNVTWVKLIIPPIIGRRTASRTTRFRRNDVVTPACQPHWQYNLHYGIWLVSWSRCNDYDQFGPIRITRHTTDSALPQPSQIVNANEEVSSYLVRTVFYIIFIRNTSTVNGNIDDGYYESKLYVTHGHG